MSSLVERRRRVATTVSAVVVTSSLALFAPAGAAEVASPPATFEVVAQGLMLPRDLSALPDGDLLVADTMNHVVKQISPTGETTVVAGGGETPLVGGDDPTTSVDPTEVNLGNPVAAAQDADGNTFILLHQPTDEATPALLAEISAETGDLSVVAGGGDGGAVSSTSAVAALGIDLDNPAGLAIDDTGLYFVEVNRASLLRFDEGAIQLVEADDLDLELPTTLAVADHVLYVFDYQLHQVIAVEGGQATVIAGGGATPLVGGDHPSTGVPATEADLGFVSSILVTGDSIYLGTSALVVRLEDGALTVVAGLNSADEAEESEYSSNLEIGDSRPALRVVFYANALAVSAGELYVIDFSGLNRIGEGSQNLAVPTITGTPTVGVALTASTGTWVDPTGAFTYQWRRSDSEAFAPIPGATSATYTPGPDDVGHALQVAVTHSGETTPSAATANVKVGQLTLTGGVTISGTAQVGATLTASAVSWTPADTTTSYRWQADLGEGYVGVGTGATYVPTVDVLGKRVRVLVDGSRAGYADRVAAATVQSAPIAPGALAPTSAPTLTGIPAEGSTLTVDPGTWPEGTTTSVSWTVRGVSRAADAASDGRSVTLLAGDAGAWVTATVAGAKAGYSGTATATAGPVGVAPGLLTLTVTKPDSTPLAGAAVSVCSAAGSCRAGASTVTGADGTYRVAVEPGVAYTVVVDGGSDHLASSLTFTGATTVTKTITMSAVPAVDNRVGSSGGSFQGMPSLTIMDFEGVTFTVVGCATAVAPTWSLGGASGTLTLKPNSTNGSGIGTFTTAKVHTYDIPNHGVQAMTTTVPTSCAAGSPTVTSSLYIDPAGVVLDQYGSPVTGATVTLSRADNPEGPFIDVPDGSEIMDADNRANPMVTEAGGAFQWDVIAGWYKVTATKDGCSTAVTEPMQVPPIQVDLALKITCVGAVPPTASVEFTGTPAVGATLRTTTGAWGVSRTVGVQWLANGTPIAGATSATLVVTKALAGKKIAVRQTATRQTWVDTYGRFTLSFSAAPAVTSVARAVAVPAKASSTVALARIGTGKVTRKSTVKLSVTVRASNGATPTGTLTVMDGKKVLRTVSVTAAAKGRVTVTLPKLKKGKHALSVAFAGNASVNRSTSKVLSLKVK